MINLFNSSNSLKDKLRAGTPCLGLFHLTSSCIVSESLSVTPIDWLAYDMEASPSGKMALVQFLQSMKGSKVTPVVRTESSTTHHLEQVLDAGVCAIIIPKVETKEQCQRIASALRYPPAGKRGVNPVRASSYFTSVKDYFSSANAEIMAFVQIESALSIQNIDEILSVDGIDGAFIGCGDLAMDLGCAGEMESEKLLAAIEKILSACKAAGKTPGIFAYSIPLAQKFIQNGFKLVAFGNDVGILQKSVNADFNLLTAK